jgi:hypothetical protein
MSTPSITTTQSPSVTGLFAGHYHHYKKELVQTPSTPAVSTPSSAGEPLASAIAAALTQLGLTSNTNVAGTDATGSTALASLTQQQKVSPQIQQYKNMAATSSSLAQALNASSGGTSSTSSADGSGSLTSVFQSLWSSLGSSSGAATDASSSNIPSLPSFLKTLAHNLSESGITGLRGVFVDTVA